MTRTPRSRTPSTHPLLESLESRVLLSAAPQIVATLPGDSTYAVSNMVADRNGNLFVAVYSQLFELAAGQTTPHVVADVSTISSDPATFNPLALFVDDADNVYAFQLHGYGSRTDAQVFEVPANASTPRVDFTFTAQTGIPEQVAIDHAGNIFAILKLGTDHVPTLVKIKAGDSDLQPIGPLALNDSASFLVFDKHNNAFGLSTAGIFEIPANAHAIKTLVAFGAGSPSPSNLFTTYMDAAGNFFAEASSVHGSASLIELPAHHHTIVPISTSFESSSDHVLLDANDNVVGLAGDKSIFEQPVRSATHVSVTDPYTLSSIEYYTLVLAAPNVLYIVGNPFVIVPANVPAGPVDPPLGPPATAAITLYKVVLPTPTPPPTPSPRFHPTSPHSRPLSR